MTTIAAPAIPVLSFAERDRRWAAVRSLLREKGLAGVVVGGFRAREMYESYISDDYNEGCTILPLEGDPVVVTWAPLRVMRARYSEEMGYPLWVSDYRVAGTGATAAEVIKEMGLDGSRVGVVGLRSVAPTEIYGSIPAMWWEDFSGALPGATFEDISEDFSYLMLVKSEEELAQMRYGAAAAEAACQAMLDVAEPGIGEEMVFAEGVAEILRWGIGLRYPNIVMNSGAATLSWGPPRWTTRAEPPRKLQRGDLLQAELMPLCGNQEVQVQMTIALDPLDEMNQKCEKVARASYKAGLEAIRPGIPFEELVSAMEVPFRQAGCWAYTPLVHSVGPHFLTGRTAINQEDLNLGVKTLGGVDRRAGRKAVLKPGMVFAFEPNACLDRHRVNIGGTVIVTETGGEALNEIPTRVSHK